MFPSRFPNLFLSSSSHPNPRRTPLGKAHRPAGGLLAVGPASVTPSLAPLSSFTPPGLRSKPREQHPKAQLTRHDSTTITMLLNSDKTPVIRIPSPHTNTDVQEPGKASAHEAWVVRCLYLERWVSCGGLLLPPLPVSLFPFLFRGSSIVLDLSPGLLAMGIMREVDAQSGAGIASCLPLQRATQPDVRELEQQIFASNNTDKTHPVAPHRRPRYAVLLCADDSDHVRRRHGGYLGVFLALLAEEGERWDGYRVSRGQFPPGWGDDEREDDVDSDSGFVESRRRRAQTASLDLYDGFVVTGSCSDAHGEDPWIRNVVALLRAACARGKRVLGICFGHQVLCRALGGKTGRAAGGWDIGVTTVNFNLFPPGTKQPHAPSTSLPVIECHQDEVLELPPGAEALAWSEKTGVEAFRYGDVAMGIQGHPEYTQDILLDLIDRLLQKNCIEISHANAARDSLGVAGADREAWRTICINFLKGRGMTTTPIAVTTTS